MMKGNEIRQLRRELGLTIEEAARQLGISWHTLWRKEKNMSRASKPLEGAIRRLRGEEKEQKARSAA